MTKSNRKECYARAVYQAQKEYKRHSKTSSKVFFFEQIILNVMQILRSEDCKSNSNLKSIKRKQHEQRVSKTAECGVGRTERSPVWLELHNNGRPFSFQGYWGIVEGFLAKGCEC